MTTSHNLLQYVSKRRIVIGNRTKIVEYGRRHNGRTPYHLEIPINNGIALEQPLYATTQQLLVRIRASSMLKRPVYA